MLCARVLRGHHEGEKKQIFVLRVVRGVFQGWLQRLRMGARPGAGLQVDHAAGHARDARRHGLALHRRSRRVSSRPRTPASCWRAPRRSRTSRSRRWSSASASRRDHPRRTRRCSTSTRRSASAAELHAQPRPHVGRAQAQARARAAATRCIQRLRRRPPGRRHGRVLPDDPEHQHRRPDHQERSTSTRCNRATPRRSTRSRPNCATRLPSSRACATSPPTSTSPIRR